MSDTGGYKAFRQRLDAVLRQRDPALLRAFLVREGQWQAEAQTDVEAAMWMMIATSPALGDLHEEARRWLLEHGHASEANAIFGRQSGRQGRGRHEAPRPRGRASGPRGERESGQQGEPRERAPQAQGRQHGAQRGRGGRGGRGVRSGQGHAGESRRAPKRPPEGTDAERG